MHFSYSSLFFSVIYVRNIWNICVLSLWSVAWLCSFNQFDTTADNRKILQNNCIKYKINSWNPNKILMCKVNKKWNRSLDRTIMIYTIKREVMVTNKKWRTQTHNVYKRKMTYAQNRRTHKKNKKDNFTEIVCIKSEI